MPERLRRWLSSGNVERPTWMLPAGALLYGGLGILSLEALRISAVAPIWPGAGIALLLALWFGWRGLAALWVVDVAMSLLAPTSVDLAVAPATAAVVTLEAAVGAGAMVALGVDGSLRSARDAISFVFAILAGAATGALLGSVLLVATGDEAVFAETLKTWWLADTCGGFLVGGLGLVIAAGRLPRDLNAARLIGALGLVAAAAAAINTLGDTAFVALIPAVTLAAVLGRAPGALAAGVVALIATLPFAESGASTFGERGVNGVLELEAVLMALTVTVLVLASTLDARDDALADLTRRAATDDLTGLANRFGLETLLHRQAPLEEIGVILVNLDGLRTIKSGIGYETGDEFLCQTAVQMGALIPPGGTLARLEGDEFAILLELEEDAAGAVGLAERLVDALDRPVEIGGLTVQPSVSIGVAHTTPAKALVDAAAALHEAKRAGGGRWHLSRTGASGRHPLRREAELRRAIGEEQLVPFFQPIVRMADGAVVGCEALARWRHPERGLLGPSEFVPIAEQGDVIHELGAVVLRAACQTAAQWPGGVSVSVNLSARQLREELALEVEAVLAEASLPPGRLELELTETALLDGSGAGAVLTALQAMGVRLALDDFGTGWSSLEMAQKLQVDTVKIDRAFVAEVDEGTGDARLIPAMVAMARALGARSVAEGIETPFQHARLRELGAESGQGFLYARPMPAEELDEYLARVPVAA